MLASWPRVGACRCTFETLALANKCATVSNKVQNLLLADFPNGLVDGFDVLGDSGDVLHRSVVSDDHVLHVVIP